MRIKQILLLSAGLACVGIGIFRGEITEVARKAAMICLECVGLG